MIDADYENKKEHLGRLTEIELFVQRRNAGWSLVALVV